MCVYVSHVYYMYNLCIYIYSVGLFLGKISVCVCCTLAFKCSMSSAGSSGMTGTGSDSTGCSSDLHKKKPGKRNECQRSQDWSLQVLQPFSHSLHLFTLGFWYLLISFDISCCNVWHVLHCLSFSCIETRLTKDRAATRALDVSTWTWGRNGDNESFENCG